MYLILVSFDSMVILSDYNDSATTSNPSDDPIYDRYDVFLSFRGSDTRHDFTDHLFHQLIGAGIQTFRDDDELKKGESLKQQLEKAIEQSSVSVIVFSENYASSPWCLDEVVKILEKKDHKVIPVFYKVDVSAVRFHKRSYGEAFDQHREKGYVSNERIEAWKAALSEVAEFSGFTLDKCKGRSESNFIAEIVSEVEKHLPKDNDLPKHLFGMHRWDKKFYSWFKSKDDNVCLICGTGGIGKTTIAKHLFNKYYRDFDGSCFLPIRITETWNEVGVCGLQNQLLSNLRNKRREEIRVYNSDEGTKLIKRIICNKKVLIVLDDVSEKEQLHTLLGKEQRFHPGSKIIVTTRNISLEYDFTVHPVVEEIVGLNYVDSLELFSWHAFQQGHPHEEYKQLSKEILLRCEGLPLALEVLGSSLQKKKEIFFWQKQLQKWDEITDHRIQKVMQVSYDSLEDDTVKNLFLHVACFFVGEEEDYVVAILNHCGLHANVGITNLIDRCLIERRGKSLMMHRVIQDMGRDIVREESPNEDEGHKSRLWRHEDSFKVLKYGLGTEKVQGFILDGQKINEEKSTDGSSFVATDANPYSITKGIDYVKKKIYEVLERFLPLREGEMSFDAFAKMINLKLVKLNYVHLTGRCSKYPDKLRWICWHGFPLDYLPMELALENLVALDLQHSRLKQVWKGFKEVKSLKFLNLSYSLDLCQTPDFRGLPQLERLILRGCSNLVKVCKTIGILKGLVLLDLRDCKSLRDLPGLPESVFALGLSGCNLGEFPREEKTYDGYRILKLASPSISTGPTKFLSCLPQFLRELNLENCKLSDECFPRDFGGLSLLEFLDLSGNLITSLPDCIKNISSSRFHYLSISNCPLLQSFINPPVTLKHMQVYRNEQLLEIKAGYSDSSWLRFDFRTGLKYVELEGFFKLVDARNVERKLMKKLGLESVPIDCVGEVRYEEGIFSTRVNSTEVPSCFKTYLGEEDGGEEESEEIPTSEDGGEEESQEYLPRIYYPDGKYGMSKVEYTIPYSSVGNNIVQGLNICIAIRLDAENFADADKDMLSWRVRFKVTVSNKTKDLAWTYEFMDISIKALLTRKYNQGKRGGVLWVSTWKCEDLLEPGDKIQLSILVKDDEDIEGLPCIQDDLEDEYPPSMLFLVYKCGIRTVYEDDLEEDEEEGTNDNTLRWTDKMIVSMSNTRAYATYSDSARLKILAGGPRPNTHIPGTTYLLRSPLYLCDFEEDEIMGHNPQYDRVSY